MKKRHDKEKGKVTSYIIIYLFIFGQKHITQGKKKT